MFDISKVEKFGNRCSNARMGLVILNLKTQGMGIKDFN